MEIGEERGTTVEIWRENKSPLFTFKSKHTSHQPTHLHQLDHHLSSFMLVFWEGIMQIQSLFIAFCHFSYPRSKMFQRHVLSRCSSPLPVQLPSLTWGSSTLTLATNSSSTSSEDISIEIDESAHHPEDKDPSMILELMFDVHQRKVTTCFIKRSITLPPSSWCSHWFYCLPH